MPYTQLNDHYWRYVISRRGRAWARFYFNEVFAKSVGVRRYELKRAYLKVFREMPSGGDDG